MVIVAREQDLVVNERLIQYLVFSQIFCLSISLAPYLEEVRWNKALETQYTEQPFLKSMSCLIYSRASLSKEFTDTWCLICSKKFVLHWFYSIKKITDTWFFHVPTKSSSYIIQNSQNTVFKTHWFFLVPKISVMRGPIVLTSYAILLLRKKRLGRHIKKMVFLTYVQ